MCPVPPVITTFSLATVDVSTGELRIEKDIGRLDNVIYQKLKYAGIIALRPEHGQMVSFPKKGVKVVNPLWFDFGKI